MTTTAAFELAIHIVRKLQAAGHIAYFAGGCVRDRLMGNPPKDWDVATSARPEEVGRLFPRSQMVGAAFGVVLVRDGKPLNQGGGQVEVATFRADGEYRDGRHPESVRFTSPEEDAQRRDFTCNGLFWDPVTEKLHDFVGGQKDIEARVLRAIGVPAERFGEDHLRMLRAVRFAARLGFEIEAGTLAAIQAGAANIKTVSKERVHEELTKVLTHASRAQGTVLLETTGLLREIWPRELYEVPTMKRHWGCIEEMPDEVNLAMGLVALHRELSYNPEKGPAHRSEAAAAPGAVVADLLRRDLMLTNAETAEVAWLIDKRDVLLGWQFLSKAEMKRLMADERWEHLAGMFVRHSLDEQAKESFAAVVDQLQGEGVAPEPFVNGQTLIKMGAAPGPRFRGWLEQLYDRQLNGEFADASAAQAAARALIAGSAGA